MTAHRVVMPLRLETACGDYGFTDLMWGKYGFTIFYVLQCLICTGAYKF